ncbi:MAG: hypothetical protein ACFFAE_02960 [Candidatus Hodarchaeota archaeon]
MKNKVNSERSYQILSLFAKSALAWIVIMGLIFA